MVPVFTLIQKDLLPPVFCRHLTGYRLCPCQAPRTVPPTAADGYPDLSEVMDLLKEDTLDSSSLIKRFTDEATKAKDFWGMLSYIQLVDIVMWGKIDTAQGAFCACFPVKAARRLLRYCSQC